MSGVLVLSNVEPDDVTFDSDRGSWNISRAMKDCKAGKHKVWGFCVNDLHQAIQNVEISKQKVKKFASSLKKLLETPPVILIVEDGKIWVIDGHHRIHAHKHAGISRISGYVIEEKDSAPYIIWYNGERLPPWHLKK